MPDESLPDDDADLPPELVPVAERLVRDADRLAARYPATEPRRRGRSALASANAAAASPARWRKAAWGAAAAMLIAAGIGVAGRWNAAPTRGEPGQPLAAPENRPVAATSAGPSSPMAIARPRPATNRNPRLLPAASFHNLSAPQQEAVLDLLEEDGEVMRLSI